MKLKTKQKQLVEELIQKNKEMEALKKNTRTTRMQELEIELQNYMDETVRLRQQLDHIESIVVLQKE